MSVFTTYPALVIYTCNYTDELVSVGTDKKIEPRDAICFEAQFVPNAINMNSIDKKDMGILRKNENYQETIIYQFEYVD